MLASLLKLYLCKQFVSRQDGYWIAWFRVSATLASGLFSTMPWHWCIWAFFFFFLPRRPYWGKKSSSCSSIVDSTAHCKTLGSCVEHRRRCKSFFCYNVWCIPASQCWDRCVLRGQGQKCYNQTLLFLGWGGKDFTLFCEIVYDCPHWNGFYLLQKCKRLGKPSCIIKNSMLMHSVLFLAADDALSFFFLFFKVMGAV